MADAPLAVYLFLAAGLGWVLYLALRELGSGLKSGAQEYWTRAEREAPNPGASHEYQQGQQKSKTNDNEYSDRDEAGVAASEEGPRAWNKVLKVMPSASLEEIKAAYRRAIALYHPDRVAGLAPELQALAELRAKEINAAYEVACRVRGPRS